MRTVKKTQRIGHCIANEQRRVDVVMSTTLGNLLDLLKASLGLSGKSEGTIHPSPSWYTMFGLTLIGRNRTRAILIPAYVTKPHHPPTSRIGD